jgi:hypothetical protein
MGKKIEGKVCAFCNRYVIRDLKGFIEHLRECNLKEYQEFIEFLEWVRHEREEKQEEG